MKIKEITRCIGKDIYGTLKCEYCGNEQTFSGYDDDYYNDLIIPNTNCNECYKKTSGS